MQKKSNECAHSDDEPSPGELEQQRAHIAGQLAILVVLAFRRTESERAMNPSEPPKSANNDKP